MKVFGFPGIEFFPRHPHITAFPLRYVNWKPINFRRVKVVYDPRGVLGEVVELDIGNIPELHRFLASHSEEKYIKK